METRTENIIPHMAIPAGATIKAEIEERGISQKEFARMLGMQQSHVSELLRGKRALAAEVAVRIETVLGIPATTLMALQAQYECTVEAIRQRDIHEQEAHNALAEYAAILDVQILLKYLGIACHTALEQLRVLRDAFRLPPAAQMQVAFASGNFRKADGGSDDMRNVNTWILLARYAARKVPLFAKFDHERIHECASRLREVFNENRDTRKRVADVCAEFGIRFAECAGLPKTRIDGFSFQDEDGPCIVVTNRYNRIDSFAFNVLHELGHIACGHDGAHVNFENYSREDPEERMADAFANETLIPKSVWTKSPSVRMFAPAIQRDYTAWAEMINTNKWIVLGRVGYETGIFRFTDPHGTRHIV